MPQRQRAALDGGEIEIIGASSSSSVPAAGFYAASRRAQPQPRATIPRPAAASREPERNSAERRCGENGASRQLSHSAPPSTGRRDCDSRALPRSPAGRSATNSSRVSHLALFQKYSFGSTSRTGPPCSRVIGLPSQLRRQQHVLAGEIVERHVGRVAVVAVLDDERRLRLRPDDVEQTARRHAFPAVVEARPRGDAVDVRGDRACGLRRGNRPRTSEILLLDQAVDVEAPAPHRHVRLVAEIEHRPVLHLALAGRQPARRPGRPLAGQQTALAGPFLLGLDQLLLVPGRACRRRSP